MLAWPCGALEGRASDRWGSQGSGISSVLTLGGKARSLGSEHEPQCPCPLLGHPHVHQPLSRGGGGAGFQLPWKAGANPSIPAGEIQSLEAWGKQ